MSKLSAITKKPVWLLVAIISLILVVYWGFIATDRYVSEAHVVIQSSDESASTLDVGSVLTGVSTATKQDLLYLRDYMRSVDVLKKLDNELNLKRYFSNHKIDYFSRIDKDAPIEYFHEYYLKRVYISLDSQSNVLIIKASAFDPVTAQKIVKLLLKYGEKHINDMSQKLALEQVEFIKSQVKKLRSKYKYSQSKIIEFQNQSGIMFPDKSAEDIIGIISKLKMQLVSLQAERNSLGMFQSAKSPKIINLNVKINSLVKQIKLLKEKLVTSHSTSLNKVTAKYQSFLLDLELDKTMYMNALKSLEAVRERSISKLKYVSVLQSPSYPEYAVEPKRLYNVSVSIIIILLISLIANLLVITIKEHQN